MVRVNCRFIRKIMNTYLFSLPVAVESCVQPFRVEKTHHCEDITRSSMTQYNLIH